MASIQKPTETSALPATMRAMEILRTPDGGKLALTHQPLPIPAPGELLIRVAYTGTNRADILQVEGKYPPPKGASPLPGLEISGTIAACAADVRGWSVGEPVCALLSGGGYAEYVAVPATHVLALPARLSLKEGACLPEAAATAIMALEQAHLAPGERILIHGGTSGLGLLLTQIAKAYGAEVYATVGSAEKVTFLKDFGIEAINHRTAPFAEQLMKLTSDEGVDVIIDTLGGPQLSTHFALLRRGGRMVSLAMMEGHKIESASMLRLLTHHLHWSGATLRSRSAAEKAAIMAHVRKTVWPGVATGRIRPVIDAVFALSDAEKALERMQERLHLGKILLEVAAN